MQTEQQTVSCSGAVWSRSTLFALTCVSKYWRSLWYLHLSRSMTNQQNDPCAHRRLWSAWEAKDPRFLHADREDTDQTGRMPRLIRVFAGCTGHFVGFIMWQLISLTVQKLVNQTYFTLLNRIFSLTSECWCFLHCQRSLDITLLVCGRFFKNLSWTCSVLK